MPPCYRKFPLPLRLKNVQRTEILLTDADINPWLPGDSLCDGTLRLATDLPTDGYVLALSILDPRTKLPN